tara:strand:- start:114 stop:362 length:249 start_codon:yes stop_codon:yes gene_type:complete
LENQHGRLLLRTSIADVFFPHLRYVPCTIPQLSGNGEGNITVDRAAFKDGATTTLPHRSAIALGAGINISYFLKFASLFFHI